MAEALRGQPDETEEQARQQEALMNQGAAETMQLPEVGETQLETKENVQNILGIDMLAGNPDQTTEPFRPEQPAQTFESTFNAEPMAALPVQPEEPFQMTEQTPAEPAGQGEVPEAAEQSKAA